MKLILSNVPVSVRMALLAAAFLTTACTTTTTQSFNVMKNPRVEASMIAADADFQRYDRILARDMGIFFPSDATPSEADQQRTRQIFRQAFLGELVDYEIVRVEAASALEVQATLIDLRNAKTNGFPGMRRELRDIARPGAIIFLMELKDSKSGEVLARAADSASAPAFSTSATTLTDWDAVEEAAARWARLFREFLDENLGK